MDISTTTVWLAIVGIIVLGMVIPPVVFRLSSTKRWFRGRFRGMAERRLAALNGSARRMRKTLLWLQYLAPVPFIALAFASYNTDRRGLFLELGAFVFFACLVVRVFFGEVERITAVEMEYRKFQQLMKGHESAKGGPVQ